MRNDGLKSVDDLGTALGALTAQRKILGSLADGEAVYFYWRGAAFARRQGEADRRLFHILGMTARQCISLEDTARGPGYRLLAREAMLYLDPKGGAVLSRWRNPFIGRAVDVHPVHNDPVNLPPVYMNTADGAPAMRWTGEVAPPLWVMQFTLPLFYHNILQGNYQRYVGGAYHATEMFVFSGALADLLDPRRSWARATVAWSRLCDWLPWMEMQGREGMVYFHASGHKVGAFDDLPQALKDHIDAHAPHYRSPPPADDARPNETSWSAFAKAVPGAPLKPGDG
jgi:hypothetical protein